MRDLLSWNVSLGRWGGVQVRLHVFFILFAIFALHFGAQHGLLAYAGMSLGVLLASVVLHEFGHCVAAWKTGGDAEQVLLWPFGGLAHVNVTQDPQCELATALAGPLVSLSVCLVLSPALVAGNADFSLLLNPLVPPAPALASPGWLDALKMLFWVNWLLTLVNALPAPPLDGGRALRAMIWQRWDFRVATRVTVRVAMAAAGMLWIAAWVVYRQYEFAALPLALLGVFLFFSAKQEAERGAEMEPADSTFGYDFSQGYTSLERPYRAPRPRGPGLVGRWLNARRAARRERLERQEEDDERRVDDILARLHETGLHGLSHADRALLDRVSARYRNRQR